MMMKLARAYVATLFVVELMLLSASLLLHVGFWIGVQNAPVEFPQRLLFGALLAAFVTAFLAKEKNVWKNEFKSCPAWVRVGTLALVLYGFIGAISQAVFSPHAGGPGNLFALSSLSLAVDAMPLCILYSIIWGDSVQEGELVKRSSASFVAAIVAIAYLLVDRAGYLPHPVRLEMP
jgi:hypothetical protein